MCLIIDSNIAPRIFLTSNDPDFRAVHRALFSARRPIAKVVYGGLNTRELMHNGRIRSLLAQLERAGRAVEIPTVQIDAEYALVCATGLCVSDDQHIIALARASKVRLLCSKDVALHADFTNKALIDNPRGSVYQYARHRPLLRKYCG